MPLVEITSLSTKGQIVIPQKIREKLNLSPGSKLMVIQEGDNILLKPISAPKMEQFEKLISLGDRIREELDITEDDVKRVIQEVRNESRD